MEYRAILRKLRVSESVTYDKKSDAPISLPQRGRGTARPGFPENACVFGGSRLAVDEEKAAQQEYPG